MGLNCPNPDSTEVLAESDHEMEQLVLRIKGWSYKDRGVLFFSLETVRSMN